MADSRQLSRSIFASTLSDAEHEWSDSLIENPTSFPKTARLHKTNEFSSVLSLRPCVRSAYFVLYHRPTEQTARLGVVVGKRQAYRAVTRNLVKRLVREAFRLRRLELTGWDMLIRLSRRIDHTYFLSAGSTALTQMLQAQIEGLFIHAVAYFTSSTQLISENKALISTRHYGLADRILLKE